MKEIEIALRGMLLRMRIVVAFVEFIDWDGRGRLAGIGYLVLPEFARKVVKIPDDCGNHQWFNDWWNVRLMLSEADKEEVDRELMRWGPSDECLFCKARRVSPYLGGDSN
jgi:hypothetical protein